MLGLTWMRASAVAAAGIADTFGAACAVPAAAPRAVAANTAAAAPTSLRLNIEYPPSKVLASTPGDRSAQRERQRRMALCRPCFLPNDRESPTPPLEPQTPPGGYTGGSSIANTAIRGNVNKQLLRATPE